MATRQKILIEVTWDGWSSLRLNALTAWLSGHEGLTIKRLRVTEPKK